MQIPKVSYWRLMLPVFFFFGLLRQDLAFLQGPPSCKSYENKIISRGDRWIWGFVLYIPCQTHWIGWKWNSA
ncbi:hypothetical protein BRADI_2g02624v3 [Brachypodium distachyon]|uniref:Uncharacterized protein n=1 Tax=Brachypodium distachyon TaxID=15368 RepID=A0A2K2D6J5_BRADI|nr:hypothetical protein BRADI_2g02624v3 [Brachypodium distachyon]